MNRFLKWVTWVMIPVFLLVSVPGGFAQVAITGGSGDVQLVQADDGGDDYSDKILIGLFAVVVGVLLWLGYKADKRRRDWAMNEERVRMANVDVYQEHELRERAVVFD